MEEWIGSVGGMAFTDGRLFIFDQRDPRVVVLSEKLERATEFGREGQGPGELQPPLVRWTYRGSWSFWYLAANDSMVAVYDGEAIEIFSHEGDFRSRVGGIPRYAPLAGVKYIGLGRGGTDVFYAFDRIDLSGLQRDHRTFETWVTTDSVPELIWSVPLKDPPHSGSGFISPERQARPRWAVSGDCVFVSDGESRALLRFDGRTGREDTLALPDWSVPDRTRAEREAGEARARAGLVGADLEPTALMTWTDLTVDPDGFIWIELWRSERSEPSRVAILDPSDGSFVEATLPTFPKAFGEPGTYYGVVLDGETDQHLVVRYDLSGGVQQ